MPANQRPASFRVRPEIHVVLVQLLLRTQVDAGQVVPLVDGRLDHEPIFVADRCWARIWGFRMNAKPAWSDIPKSYNYICGRCTERFRLASRTTRRPAPSGRRKRRSRPCPLPRWTPHPAWSAGLPPSEASSGFGNKKIIWDSEMVMRSQTKSKL